MKKVIAILLVASLTSCVVGGAKQEVKADSAAAKADTVKVDSVK